MEPWIRNSGPEYHGNTMFYKGFTRFCSPGDVLWDQNIKETQGVIRVWNVLVALGTSLCTRISRKSNVLYRFGMDSEIYFPFRAEIAWSMLASPWVADVVGRVPQGFYLDCWGAILRVRRPRNILLRCNPPPNHICNHGSGRNLLVGSGRG